ncbi:MAG: hypothetical protein HYX69_04710 [Planctomycetia bacterium]|nr:hypothetical protein [Planctomycetia bacterium]
MLLAILVAAVTVVVCVMFHLGMFVVVARLLRMRAFRRKRLTLAGLVLVAMTAHLLEMGFFGFSMRLLVAEDSAAAADSDAAFDSFYRSAVAYTSLGAEPPRTTPLRLLTAVEALTGLILITWTASFLFLVMQKDWEERVL